VAENEESNVIEVEEPLPGWLGVLNHRLKTFGIIAATLAIDAAFMLFWLVIHGLFTLTAEYIERLLNGASGNGGSASLAHTTSAQPFQWVFFITTTILDLAAFAVTVYFIYTDVKIFWRKISSQNETPILIGSPGARQANRSALPSGVQTDD
jgi:hypothetical protein